VFDAGVAILAGAICGDWVKRLRLQRGAADGSFSWHSKESVMDVLPGVLESKSPEANIVAPKLSAEQVFALKERLRRESDAAVDRIVAAVDGAADGRWIAESEEPSRRAIHDFGEAAFQAVLQDKIDAFEASFPPSARNGDRSRDAPAAGEAVPQ
jgi:hypothetical protein